MQLFIIHFLILPIKKFKKQKLKIIFFNFLNKCNRYNIYCVSYYKGKCLKESIYELSVDERKCFISYYYYTKTIAVIAEETGLKESTVKSKLLRGRKKLKLKMEKKGFRYEDCKIFFE